MKKIELIAYDFDGVMTDNKVYVDQKGREMVQVSRADGLGVSEIKKLGIEQIIISTEKNPVVMKRAIKLNIKCLQGIKNKKVSLISYCKENNLLLENVAFVGNDINDKEVMEIVGTTYCPSDSHKSIKAISDKVLKIKGGDGVVRQILDILKEKKNE